MKCDKIRELLSLYIDKMLDDSQMKEVEEHLAVCAACKKEFDEIKEITEILNVVESVPVPEAFEFRLKKALKEEQRNMDTGKSNNKTSKKGKWRILTSIAAVFVVGFISFGLYHDVLGILPDKMNGGDQAALKQTDEAYSAKTKAAAGADDTKSTDKYAVANKDMIGDVKIASAAAGNESPNNAQLDSVKYKVQKSKDSSASTAKTKEAPVNTNDIADNSGQAEDQGAGFAADSAVQPGDLVGSSDCNPATHKKAALSAECSRSLNASGIERNVAAVQFYENLIQNKLEGFDYQILDSNYAQNREWHFRVFIFRGKDGNTYNEEISVIGKDGGISIICSNEFMGL